MRLLYRNSNLINTGNEKLNMINEILSRDLDILKLSKSISLNVRVFLKPEKLLSLMTDDIDNILYRQQLSKDIYENEILYNELIRIYQKLTGLQEISKDMTQASKKEITNYIKVIKWLELFCEIVSDFIGLFEKCADIISAESLKKLKMNIEEIYSSEEFIIINKNIKLLSKDVHKLNSIKLGVNFNEYFEPISVNCLEINNFYYYPKKMADIVRNEKKIRGIGKLKYHPAGKMKQGDIRYDEMRAQTVVIDTTKMQRFLSCEINIGYIKAIDSFIKSLNFNNRGIIKKFILEKTESIVELIDDLGFFLGGIKMIKQLNEKGMPVCLPEIVEKERKIYEVENLYNCYLPFILNNPSENIVSNDIVLNDSSGFSILNGPNKGGKTTLIQGMCLSIILFQLGLYAPCSKAIISPADMILTHYQKEETGDKTGRLAIEAESIKMIFSNATKNSMIILNEPYVSTSPAEGMYLILSTLKAVRELGCRGMLVTHYHKLNDKVEEENTSAKDKISFLNMGIDSSVGNTRRTYELKKGRGEVKSFAMDILREYAPELLD